MVPSLRFSLSALIGATLLISLYLAALRQASAWAAAAALTLTIGLLAFSLLWALFRPSANRYFWTGFHLCAWGYLLIAFSDWSQAQLANYLVSTQVVARLHSQMPISPSQTAMVEWHGTWFPAEVLRRDGTRSFIHYTGYGANWDEWVGPDRIRGAFGPFLQICQALLSLIAGLAGGVLSVWISGATGSRRTFWIFWGCGAAAVVAAGLLGIFFDSEAAASVAFSLALALLFLTTLAGWRGRPGETAFARGFAILAGGYLLLHFGPGLETSVGGNLLTTRLVNQVQNWRQPAPAPPPAVTFTYLVTASASNPYSPAMFAPTSSVRMWNPGGQATNACVIAGHAVLEILLGILGGFVALWLARGRADAPSGAS